MLASARLSRVCKALGAMLVALVFSAIVAVSFLGLFGVFGILAGYPGLFLVLIVSVGIWIGGTIYFSRVLYRD